MIITLLGEMESKKCVCVCARVCGTVWCVVSGLRGVLIGPLIVWNRTNKCVRFFSWRGCRGAGAWLFSRFSSSQKMHLIYHTKMSSALRRILPVFSQFNLGQFCTVQVSSVQFSSVQHDKASPPGGHQEQAPKWRCTFRPTTFSSVQFSSVQFSSVQFSPDASAARYPSQASTMPYHTMPCPRLH